MQLCNFVGILVKERILGQILQLFLAHGGSGVKESAKDMCIINIEQSKVTLEEVLCNGKGWLDSFLVSTLSGTAWLRPSNLNLT